MLTRTLVNARGGGHWGRSLGKYQLHEGDPVLQPDASLQRLYFIRVCCNTVLCRVAFFLSRGEGIDHDFYRTLQKLWKPGKRGRVENSINDSILFNTVLCIGKKSGKPRERQHIDNHSRRSYLKASGGALAVTEVFFGGLYSSVPFNTQPASPRVPD